MSRIYVELRSGLGNQLFQYAFGYALASEFGKELVLCPAYFDPLWKYWLKKILGREARSLRLPLILETNNLPIKTSIALNYKSDSTMLVMDEQKVDIGLIREACEKGADFYLKGYWQNPTLFSSVAQQLANVVKPHFPLSGRYKITLDQMNDQLVGIHVRRGDFLTNRAFGACMLSYYLEAIKAIKKKVNNPTFLIFTNNRNWVESNFPSDIPYKIYNNDLNNNTDLEEMFLMTSLRSLIISNSTFSWWSAYLNRNPEKNIVCPTNWFLNKKLQERAANLVLKDWTALENELELTQLTQ